MFYGSTMSSNQVLVDINGSGYVESFYVCPVFNTNFLVEVDGEKCFCCTSGRGISGDVGRILTKPLTIESSTNSSEAYMLYINASGTLSRVFNKYELFGYRNINFGDTIDMELVSKYYYTFYNIVFKKNLKITNVSGSSEYSFIVNYAPLK